MNIKILYDNQTARDNIVKGWGFSCLVNNCILFDTGEDGGSLLRNISEMDVSLDKLEAVVISHDHWDHTGGLNEVLKRKRNINVHICSGFSVQFRKDVISQGGYIVESDNFMRIKPNVFVTGSIPGTYKGHLIEEQALVVKTCKGLSVITGCAHPGIVNIVEKVKSKFIPENIYSVIGGFHLKNHGKKEINIVMEKLNDLNMRVLGPAHCSGKEAIDMFKESFKEKFLRIAAGKEFEV